MLPLSHFLKHGSAVFNLSHRKSVTLNNKEYYGATCIIFIPYDIYIYHNLKIY